MHKIFALVALLFIAGCSTTQTTHTESQCIGAMTTQEAYGHLDPNRFTIQVLASVKNVIFETIFEKSKDRIQFGLTGNTAWVTAGMPLYTVTLPLRRRLNEL